MYWSSSPKQWSCACEGRQNHDESVLGNDADDELNRSEAHSSGADVTTDPLSAHRQLWELLQGGVTECLRSKEKMACNSKKQEFDGQRP